MKLSTWAPQCPRCFGRSERDPEAPILDCKCLHCGYHHTSPLRRGVLVALSRRDCHCAQCEAARACGTHWTLGRGDDCRARFPCARKCTHLDCPGARKGNEQ
jgi:hypothetical protein